jgi:hypothetical protein
MLINYNSAEAKEFEAEGNRRIKISIGEISGFLQMSKFIDSMRCREDMGYTSWQFDFKARGGKTYRYSALIKPWALWPSGEIVTTYKPTGDFTESVAVFTVMDSRESYCIKVMDDDPLTGFLKYTEMEVSLRIEQFAVSCRLKFYHGIDDQRSGFDGSGYCVVYYQLPFERFLWRPAARFYSDDFEACGESFIGLSEIKDSAIAESAIEVINR